MCNHVYIYVIFRYVKNIYISAILRTLNETKDVLGLGVYIGVKSCQVSTPGICIYI